MNVIHDQPHPLAGSTVTLPSNIEHAELSGQEYRIEDWWDRIAGGSWMWAKGNPACLKYGLRSGLAGLPMDDEVVYGKVGHLGHLVHVSELPETADTTGSSDLD